MDTPPNYFSGGNLVLNSNEVAKERHPPHISFLVWGGVFHPPTKTKRVLAPSILSSLKELENHLLWLKEFSQTMGNILTMFWLAKTKREVAKEMLEKNLQELACLKGQLLQLSNANWQDALAIQQMKL
jgi:hypothetical protein